MSQHLEDAPIVIVGSGLAGYTVAREVRKLDALRPIVVVTRDSGDFYSKPMLSNALAQKKMPGDLVTTRAQAMVEQLKIALASGVEIRSIDRASRRIDTSAGEMAYGQLVLALGADPIRLPLGGDAVEEVLSVNDLRDYARFRERLRPGVRVAIIGGGLIGCEFANDLVADGYAVTVIDPMAHPLASLLPAAAAETVRAGLAAAGVTWRLGTGVASVQRRHDGLVIGVTEGDEVVADVVLSAVGLRPRASLAREAGLPVNRGIVVDRFARTSDPHIFALGDCAEYEGRVLPYVLPIMNAAKSLARSLVGEPTPIVFPTMPVTVKTPACPVAVVPVQRDLRGSWEAEGDATVATDGIKLLFRDENAALRGFALTGKRCADRQAVTKLVVG